MVPPECFNSYFLGVFVYLKKVGALAVDNGFLVLSTSMVTSAGISFTAFFIDDTIFGVSNFLLALVLLTVFIDAYYGTRKSIMQSNQALLKAQDHKEGTPEYKMLKKVYERRKFNSKKLQFIFFKCFTLMGYLFFVQVLIDDDGSGVFAELLGITLAILAKAPVAIFWYYDFKSIGKNSEYIYKKKAPIFKIAEAIFEPRIFKFFNKDKDRNETNLPDNE